MHSSELQATTAFADQLIDNNFLYEGQKLERNALSHLVSLEVPDSKGALEELVAAKIGFGDNTCNTTNDADPACKSVSEAITDEVDNMTPKRDVWTWDEAKTLYPSEVYCDTRLESLGWWKHEDGDHSACCMQLISPKHTRSTRWCATMMALRP